VTKGDAQRPRGRLIEGSVGGHLLRLTVPMSWGIFSVIAINLADVYFIGRLGTEPLAAVAFTFPVVMLVMTLTIGLGIGSSSVISRAIGEADRHRVRRLTTDSLFLAIVFVGLAALIGLATIAPVFRLLGAGPALMPMIADYMTIWYGGAIFLAVPMVGNAALRAAGDARSPSLVMTVAALVNLVLDPLLIFGLAGFPRLEIAGAAIATIVSYGLGMIASLAILHFRERMLVWHLPAPLELIASWRRILHVGLPAAATNLIVPLSTAVITALMAGFGTEAVAAFGVVTRIEAFAILVLMALSASMGPFVGQNFGAGRHRRIRRALRLASGFSIGWGLLVAVLLGLFARPLVGLFNDGGTVVAIGADYLRIVPVSYAGLGLMMIASAAFNGSGRPMPSMAMVAVRLVVLYVPLAFLGARLYGITGIFAAALIANLASGALAVLWARWGFGAAGAGNAERPALDSAKPGH
jgi:MATE family, multidrug efflux pump